MTDPIDDVSEDSVELYFTEEDLEARLSKATVQRILDDNNDGETDYDPLQQIRKDSCSKVSSYIIGVYEYPLTQPYPHEVTRLALDVAVAYAAQRHPEVVKKDWEKLMKAAEADLMKLKKGETRLDAKLIAVQAPVNRQAKVVSQNPDEQPGPPKKFFVGGTSDF